jgi:hypothetical protein
MYGFQKDKYGFPAKCFCGVPGKDENKRRAFENNTGRDAGYGKKSDHADNSAQDQEIVCLKKLETSKLEMEKTDEIA